MLPSLTAFRVARCPAFDRTVRFLGDVSGPKREAKPDNKLSGFFRPSSALSASDRKLRQLLSRLTEIERLSLYCTLSVYLLECSNK